MRASSWRTTRYAEGSVTARLVALAVVCLGAGACADVTGLSQYATSCIEGCQGNGRRRSSLLPLTRTQGYCGGGFSQNPLMHFAVESQQAWPGPHISSMFEHRGIGSPQMPFVQ
jgi:hypothetical protein